MVPFSNRTDAGRQLATALNDYATRPDLLVLGLPRGGVVVAKEVADGLQAPLDVCLVRKLGVPGHVELAMGAIAEGGVQVLNADLIADLGIHSDDIARVAAREQRELERRRLAYGGQRALPVLRDRTVILVDDGLATGATMEAAVKAVKAARPREVVVAVPVGATETCSRLGQHADRVVCLHTPEPFSAVGLWYRDFSEVGDEDVARLLQAARGH